MPLLTGSRLGPYEVIAPLGAGGMGEVYRARDTRLAREVAVKILPAALAADADRLERFEREARAASSLSHPNIVTIFDIGVQDGTSYIAMEVVEGTTLRGLAKEPVAPRKILEIAAQIAAGLARAHAAGIVHRDLKPENVMVTRDGHVKILDFGLAKVSAASGPLESNVETAGITEAGVVLGTASYMSPEQAGGGAVDFRSDQFAFGAILYELATGRRAFHGKTLVDTLGAVLNDEPAPVARLAPGTPAPLRWIVDRCLAKDPRGRYASTDDLALELANLRDHLSEAAVPDAGTLPTTRARRGLILGLTGAAAAVLVLAFLIVRPRPAPAPSFRPLTFRRGTVLQARFAPDGQTVVYGAAFGGNPTDVFVARLDSLESRPLGIPGSTLLSVSRKGSMALAVRARSVADSLYGTLAEMPLSTAGAPREILEDVLAADYDPTGEALAVVRIGSLHGQKTGVHLELPPGNRFVEGFNEGPCPPRFSPDGRLVAFGDYHVFTREGIPKVADREGRVRPLSERWNDLGGLAWGPAADEVWISGERPGRPRGIYALTPGGGERLVWRGPGTLRLLDADRSGRALVAREEYTSILFASGSGAEREMSWLDASQLAAISDDGRTLLFTDRSSASEPGSSVYIRRTDGSAPARLCPGRALDLSADGRFALVQRGSEEEPRLFLVPTAAGQERPVDIAPLRAVDARFFRDGKRLLVLGEDPKGVQGQFVRDLDSGAWHCITPEGAHYRNALSSDGRFTLGMGRRENEGKTFLYPTDPATGPPREVPGIEAQEFPVSFTADGTGAYVVDFWVQPPWQVTRVDLATGERTPWKTIAPSDPAGILRLGVLRISPDGSVWAYSARRELGTLFLAEGLK